MQKPEPKINKPVSKSNLPKSEQLLDCILRGPVTVKVHQ